MAYFFVKFYDFLRAILCALFYNKIKDFFQEKIIMYVSITGNKGNQDVYIKQSYRKENGKTSSRIYKKLGKYNELLAQFSGDATKMMEWAKEEATKETQIYNQKKEKVSISLSPLARIPLNEERLLMLAICSCNNSAPS